MLYSRAQLVVFVARQELQEVLMWPNSSAASTGEGGGCSQTLWESARTGWAQYSPENRCGVENAPYSAGLNVLVVISHRCPVVTWRLWDQFMAALFFLSSTWCIICAGQEVLGFMESMVFILRSRLSPGQHLIKRTGTLSCLFLMAVLRRSYCASLTLRDEVYEEESFLLWWIWFLCICESRRVDHLPACDLSLLLMWVTAACRSSAVASTRWYQVSASLLLTSELLSDNSIMSHIRWDFFCDSCLSMFKTWLSLSTERLPGAAESDTWEKKLMGWL